MRLEDNTAGSKTRAVFRLPSPFCAARWRSILVLLSISLVFLLYLTIPSTRRHRSAIISESTTYIHEHLDPLLHPDSDHRFPFQHTVHGHNYALTGAQCDAYFPGFFEEIDKSIENRKDRPIEVSEIDRQGDKESNTRIMLYDGDMYIVADGGKQPDERTMALLHGLHRAIITDPERHKMPDIEFVLGREDWLDPEQVQWGLTKLAEHDDNWVVPDFGFWSWATPSVGSYQSIRRKIDELEQHYPTFESKIDKLVWRGALNVGLDIRESLYNASQGKPWSDVEKLDWSHGLPDNLIFIEDHCKYQFVAQTEGNSYSGRQKYIHNCNSVIVSHELIWLQPWHKFMVDEGPDQNYVRVKNDFSDLDEKMQHYLANPALAAKIAENNVKTFRDRYLTPAAQACYWRKLIRGYGSVSYRPELYGEPLILEDVDAPGVPGHSNLDFMNRPGKPWRGTPFENYVINGNLDYRQPRRFGYQCYDEAGARREQEEKAELEAERMRNQTEASASTLRQDLGIESTTLEPLSGAVTDDNPA